MLGYAPVHLDGARSSDDSLPLRVRQRALLAYRKGEVDLMYIKGVIYIAVVCDVLDPEEMGIERILVWIWE